MLKHLIINIDFDKDYLQRTCGWVGKASDVKDNQKHNKECLVRDDITDVPDQYEGKFMKKSKVN